MKRVFILISAMFLCLSICACGGKAPETKEPSVYETPVIQETQEEPEPAPELEMSPFKPEPQRNPVEVKLKVLRTMNTPVMNCSLIAVNPESFSDGTVNFRGAGALINYLMSYESISYASVYGVEEYGEKLFCLSPERLTSAVEPAPADESSKTVRLAVSSSIFASGLLDRFLPDFEEEYGYTVAVFTDTSGALVKRAETGTVDVLFVNSEEAEESFVGKDFATKVEGLDREINTFVYMKPVLCGPEDDPAGAENAPTDAEALKRIAEGGFTLITCGRDSGTYAVVSELLKLANLPENAQWIKTADSDIISALLEANESGAYIIGAKPACVHFVMMGF